MKPDAYRRNIAARAFDVARYLLFWGVPTNVGQVTQHPHPGKADPPPEGFGVCRTARVWATKWRKPAPQPPDCVWDARRRRRALAPTLARHADADTHAVAIARAICGSGREQNLPPAAGAGACRARRSGAAHRHPADIVATLLYPVTDRPFRELYEMAAQWSGRSAPR